MSKIDVAMMSLIGANAVIGLLLLRRKAPTAVTPPPAPKPAAQTASDQVAQLTPKAEAEFEQAVNDSIKRFARGLDDTSTKINQLITRLTTEVIDRELNQYRESLATARQQALEKLGAMQTDVERLQKSLQSDLDDEMTKRKQILLQRLDQRLGEAVSAYLVESLGQGADLGAQRKFVLDSLERHKEDIKKDLSDGA